MVEVMLNEEWHDMKNKSLEESLLKSEYEDCEWYRTVSGFAFAERVRGIGDSVYRERFLRGAPQVDYDPRGEDMPLMKELRRQMECLKKQ